jgi:hypothetical protein
MVAGTGSLVICAEAHVGSTATVASLVCASPQALVTSAQYVVLTVGVTTSAVLVPPSTGCVRSPLMPVYHCTV